MYLTFKNNGICIIIFRLKMSIILYLSHFKHNKTIKISLSIIPAIKVIFTYV